MKTRPPASFARNLQTPVGSRSETGTVLAVGAGTVDVRMAGGEVYRHVPLAGGSPSVGSKIAVAFLDGRPASAAGSQTTAGQAGLVVLGSGSGGGGAGVYAPSPHALNSAHHTGEIATTQATWAMPLAGGTFTGNVGASAGVTFDGVDISAHAASASAHHNPVTVGNTGLSLSTQEVSLALAGTSGLAISSGLMLADTIAGNGLTIASKVLAVNTAYAFTWSALHTFGEGIAISAGKKVTWGGDTSLSRKMADVLQVDSGVYFESESYTTGSVGWQITGTGNAEFNNVKVRGSLHAAIFVKDLIEAHAGTLMVSKSSGKLVENMVVPTSGTWTMIIADPPNGGFLFGNGDICRCKSEWGVGVKDIWFTVSDGRTSTGPGQRQQYTCTYAYGDRSSEYTYVNGGVVVDYGVSGDGFVSLSADGSIGAAQNLSIATHAGEPWDGVTLRARLGNLNGSFGQTSDVYGIGLGSYSGGNYLLYNGTEFTIKAGGGGVTINQLGLGITVPFSAAMVRSSSISFVYDTVDSFQIGSFLDSGNLALEIRNTDTASLAHQILISTASPTSYAASTVINASNATVTANVEASTASTRLYFSAGTERSILLVSDGIVIIGPILTGLNLGTATGATVGEIIGTQSTNGVVQWEINNANTGSGASAALQLTSDVVTGRVAVYSDAAGGGERMNITASGGYMLLGTQTDEALIIYQNNAECGRFTTDGGLSLGTAGTAELGAITGTQSVNSGLDWQVVNANAGSSASAALKVTSDTLTGEFRAYAAAAGGARLNVVANGALMLLGTLSAHDLRFYTNNAKRGQWTSAGGLEVDGDTFRIITAKTPASAGAAGSVGQIAWDASYIYVCTATNTWKRIGIATW